MRVLLTTDRSGGVKPTAGLAVKLKSLSTDLLPEVEVPLVPTGRAR